MRKAFPYILLLALLTSCGLDARKGRNPASTLAVGQALNGTPEKLTASDKTVADRICQAYRSKRFTYASMLGTPFVFLFEEEDCDGEKDSQQINTLLAQTLSSAPLIFDSTDSNPYFKQVPTDLHSDIANLCTDVLNGDTPLNTISAGANTIKVFDFFRTGDELDAYTVSVAVKDEGNGDTQYIVKEKTELAVRTDANAGTLRGLILRRTQVSSCNDNSSNRELKQTFLRN